MKPSELLTLKWALNDQYAQFTSLQSGPSKLSEESFGELRDYTRRIAGTEEDLEFCLYSLACNDLGKTLFLVEKHKEVTGGAAEDHDQLLYTLTQKAPDLFPAFQTLLTPEQRQRYADGLGANLNLGQFVQGENLPVNLMGMQALESKSRELRLVCELFDFAGVTGHVNASGSIVMNRENHLAFSAAIGELTKEPLDQSYKRYIAQRAALAGIDASTPEGFAQGRVAALSRIFTAEQGRDLRETWGRQPEGQRRTLTAEFNATGADGRKGVLIYYAPAVITNAVKATGNYAAGLMHALNVFARVFEEARANARDQDGSGVITVNVSHLAKQAAQLPKAGPA